MDIGEAALGTIVIVSQFGVIDTAAWGFVLIWIAGILTVWSMVYYLQKAWPDILDHAK